MSEEIRQQSKLPGVKYVFYLVLQTTCWKHNRDPNLWLVRCRLGEEKDAVLRVMRKFLAYEATAEVSWNLF